MTATTLTRPTTEWLDGAPERLRPETLAIDKRLSQRMRCAHCRAHGLGFRPQHCGRRYRVLCPCPRCKDNTEL